MTVPANATQGGWISVRVPQQVKAGKYTGTVTVKDGDKVLSLSLIHISHYRSRR